MTTLSFSAEQVKRFDYDRFICALFAPPDEREALFALYAFNIEVARIRETVSQPMLGQIRLQWWAETLEAVYAGQPPRHQVAMALAGAVDRFGLSRRHFDALLDARAFDMEEGAPADLPALIAYAEATSASLALLSLEILGASDDDGARDAARLVGIGWALAGLLRAVPFHARQRRIYLPTSLNREAGLDVFQLFDLRASTALAAVVRVVAETARDHLQAAREARRRVPKQAICALLPATVAEDHLKRLRRAGFDPFAVAAGKPGPGLLARIAFNAARAHY